MVKKRITFMLVVTLISGCGKTFLSRLFRSDHGEFTEILTDFLDAAIILAIVALNAFLGVLQESRAEKALEALKALSAPRASVLRNGEEKEIPAEEVV